MTKNFLLLFCFISSFAFSQEYHFDYFIKEKTEHQISKKEIRNNEWFYDTENDVRLDLESQNNKTIAILYSKDYKLKHIFEVKNLGKQINFRYIHSRKIYQGDIAEIQYKGKDVFELKKLDSLKYSFVVFTDLKKKKKSIDAIVNLKVGDFEFLDFRIDHIITRKAEKQLKNLLNQNQKYIVRSVDYKYNSKYRRYNIFELIQKVDLSLTVPDVLKEPKHWSDFEE